MKINKFVSIALAGFLVFGNGYTALATSKNQSTEESSQADFNERIKGDLEAEQYYFEHYYDDECEFKETEDDIEDNRSNSNEGCSLNSNGKAVVNATSNTINGNNLTYQYKIINIPKIDSSNVVIQKSYIGTSYLYFIQTKGSNLYFSRAPLPTSGNVINAVNAERMTLTGFGHSQVLEYFEYQGTGYFWVGCYGATDGISSTSWARQIGRIKFQAGATKKSYQIKRLSKINCANKTGSSLGTIRRVEAALSSDKQYLLLWARTYDTVNGNNGLIRSNVKTRFSIYNATAVNAALTSSSTNNLDCNTPAMKAACIKSFEFLPGNDNNNTYIRKLRFGSNQGLEMSNLQNIFVGSEARENHLSTGKFIIKLNSSGTITKTTEITGSVMGAGSSTEMEGLQLKDSMLYFINKDYTTGSGKYHYIYKIAP